MADAEPRKRSRFDQKEPEPKRTSRFDRRSRSPPTRISETRERSPLGNNDSAADPAAAAGTSQPQVPRMPLSHGSTTHPRLPVLTCASTAAAAAKINAQLQARKGIQHVDVPPIQGAVHNGTPEASSTAPEAGKGAPGAPGEMYVSDGDYIQDIEVNDLRNRYMLMKAQTQQSIQKDTGADLTVRGKYYPNKSMATAAEPPLYLHITARTKEVLEAAVAKVNELIEQELPQLVDERRFKRRDREPEAEDTGRRNKWPEESIPVGLEPVPGFNLRAQIVGAGGSYVKHIQQETGCRVQIKGRGSGYIERDTNQESDDEMFLHVAGPDPAMVEKAKELCQDLIENVREQYEEFRSRPPRQHGDRGSYGGDRGYGGDRRGGYNDRGGDHYSGRGGGGDSYSGYGRQGSDSGSRTAGAGSDSPANADYTAQYAQYYAQAAANGQDPYAAYGGYANYVAMYQQYYAQYQQGQAGAAQSPGQAPAASASPPPPPSDSAPPPPPPADSAPPPPPGASGGYSAVPPPPGL
ncbi:hypothetical protein LLEC1_03920 [Akanthomyces lecanii]|uniref:K Homology domain-containing protein n=1 Tax=Cordyceps confragosa TaxID=2714763 RepID=A0A179I6F8_CORDF|nr:hypothetical protein LLEC1_03920 [Akanthomyces lecanii]